MSKDEYYELVEAYIVANHPNCVLGPLDLNPMKRHVEKELEESFDIGLYMDCFGEVFTKVDRQWKFTGRSKHQQVDESVDELTSALESTLTLATTEAIRPDEDKRLSDLLVLIKKGQRRIRKSQ